MKMGKDKQIKIQNPDLKRYSIIEDSFKYTKYLGLELLVINQQCQYSNLEFKQILQSLQEDNIIQFQKEWQRTRTAIFKNYNDQFCIRTKVKHYLLNQIALYALKCQSSTDYYYKEKSMEEQSVEQFQQSFAFLCEQFEVKQGTISFLGGENHRGIKATRKIFKNQIILQIPYKYFINQNGKTAEQSYLIQYFRKLKSSNDLNSTLSKDNKLSSMINNLDKHCRYFSNSVSLIEKISMNTITNSDNQVEIIHNHIINTLPKNYNYHPINYIEAFKPYHNFIFYRLKWDIDNRKKFVDDILQLLSNSSYLSFKQFLHQMKKGQLYDSYVSAFNVQSIVWAVQVVVRQTHILGLIPLYILFNQLNVSNAYCYFNDNQGKLTLKAVKSINVGQEIFLYNDKSMQERFCGTGNLTNLDNCLLEIPNHQVIVTYYNSGLKISFQGVKIFCTQQCENEQWPSLLPDLQNLKEKKNADWKKLKEYLTEAIMSEHQSNLLFSVLKIIEIELQTIDLTIDRILENKNEQENELEDVEESKEQ